MFVKCSVVLCMLVDCWDLVLIWTEWTKASDRSPSDVFMANFIKASKQ